MEKQKIVSILNFYRNIDDEIELNKRATEALETQYYDLNSGRSMDNLAKGKGTAFSPTEKAALNVPQWVGEQLRKLWIEQNVLHTLKDEIQKELDRLPFIQRMIVHSFYIKGVNWVQISNQVHYSERQCKNIRNIALTELGRCFSSNKVIFGFFYPQ